MQSVSILPRIRSQHMDILLFVGPLKHVEYADAKVSWEKEY